ncbi:hypothetical protein [Glaesserella parasuis]|uniref:Uncharacterized protein n=2 Tax=Glaesserella parasuis TaxID=738 RepID=A0AAJ6AED1_GLAPU|nr:hypothetical protein [Glaesserella parasuis]MDG6362148.1 hypothetical protein [Glaesserella parasuis]MDO9815091.1 hypothetical protein [Glaesserella parasuis]WGE09932.1 hypothetical protein QBL01_12110 [Glaesserella parasuis]
MNLINNINLIKLWLPSAISILLLSIELPLIAFLMLDSPIDITHNYTVAIAYLMFANAIIYPIAPFVVKNGNNSHSLKWGMAIIISVFFIFNGYVSLFIDNHSVREVSHFLSISLIFIGLKRYLQACLIINKYTLPISQSAFVRVFITCTMSILLLNQELNARYDILVVFSILSGGFVEVILLGCYLYKRNIKLLENKIQVIPNKENISSYLALVLLFASYLASNLLLMIFFKDDEWVTQYWTMIFTLSSLSIYPLLDVDSIFIKIKQDYPSDLYGFCITVSIVTSIFSLIILFVLSTLIKSESLIQYIYTPYFFSSFIITPFLWNVRSIMRIEYILSNQSDITICTIIGAFVLSLSLGRLLNVFSPVILFNMIILAEILIYFLYKWMKKYIKSIVS